MEQQQRTFPIQLSEPEIKMVIQNVIDDLGDIKSAQRWVRNKLHSINHTILVEGKTPDMVESRDEWAIIDQYFERHMYNIERAQKTKTRLWP